MNKDIFQIGGEVSGESFIGRRELVETLRSRFVGSKSRTAISIVGLLRMGKTSVVKNTFYDLPEHIIYVYENLNQSSRYSELWQFICAEIQDQLQHKGIPTDEIDDCFRAVDEEQPSWVKMNRSVKKIFAFLAEQRLKTILVLDEFDNASKIFTEGVKHFELFRTIFSDGKYNVSAITVSRRSLHMIEGTSCSGSTFRGIFDSLPFKGFDAFDMDEYFRVFEKQGIALNDEQKQEIVYYAGNVPYLLSILGYYIMEMAANGEPVDIHEIFLEKCKAINDYYKDCLRYMEEEGNLQRIIPFVFGPKIGVTQSDKDELFNLGYFREQENKLIVISEYFMAFLTANQLSVSIWDNVIHVEKLFKQLIERELTTLVKHYEVHGGDLNEVLLGILKSVPAINNGDINRYNSYIANNARDFKLDTSYLEVMSLSDAVEIIMDNWHNIFSRYFDTDLKTEWEMKFRKCAWARNPLAHGHEDYMTPPDRKEVDVYCQQISEKLAKTIETVKMDKTPVLKAAKYLPPHPGMIQLQEKMRITKIAGEKETPYLRGVVQKMYCAEIPQEYLQGTDLRNILGKTYQVRLERIKDNHFIAKPVDNLPRSSSSAANPAKDGKSRRS